MDPPEGGRPLVRAGSEHEDEDVLFARGTAEFVRRGLRAASRGHVHAA
ncbi:hypothetical protein [Streptomyces sp. enrichment culture]